MTEVNPFGIEFDDSEEPTRNADFFGKALQKMEEEDSLTDEEKAVLEKGFENAAEELEQGYENDVDVPEIETEIKDLPEEDTYEKELTVDHNPTKDSTMDDGLQEVFPEDVQLDGDVMDNDGEYDENAVRGYEVEDPTVYPTDENLNTPEKAEDETREPAELSEEEQKKYQEFLEEAQAMAQNDLDGFKVPKNWDKWTAKQKADSIKAFLENQKQENKKTTSTKPKEKMEDDDIRKEAEAIAQQPLPGFRPPANWGDLSFEEKSKIVKNYSDTKKVEDHRTTNDNSETNNFESYKRYPTGLKVTEDLLGEANTIAGGAKDVIQRVGKQGTNSGSIANEVARSVPHYDYRSLFR